MSIARIYVPDLRLGLNPLSREESHHAINVLRLRLGDAVVAFDGAGHEGVAKINTCTRNAVDLDISDVAERPYDASLRLTLAVALGKSHRQGYLFEKCTELGVAAIWPMISQRSVSVSKENATDKRRRRAVEAAKQSQRAWVPEIRSSQTFEVVIANRPSFDFALIADTTGSPRRLAVALSDAAVGAKVLTLVGPEGGWTDLERKQAEEADFSTVSLSPNVLRTETAAVAVCAAIAMREDSK